MKKIFYTFLLCTALLSSCKKFLEEYSQDEMRPGSTDDLTALMYSDAYPYISKIENFEALTDDLQNNPLVSVNGVVNADYLNAVEAATLMFTFSPNMFDGINSTTGIGNLYSAMYLKIKGCNVVIDQLDKVPGTERDKNAIMGQCLFLRGYYYLKLVTAYAQMYTAPGVDPSTALGVPLILSSQVKDGGVPRSTLKEVYDQIEKDLMKAEELLRNNYVPPNAFRIGSDLANGILSRYYLYKGGDGDWDKAIQSAGRALQNRSTLTSLTSFLGSSGNITPNGIYNSSSPEVLWVYGGVYPDLLTANFDSRSLPPFTVSASLISQYDKGTGTANYGDLRYQYYFQFNTLSGSKFPYRTGKNTVNAPYGIRGFRVAELYLNRAEAYIRNFIKNGNAADRLAALNDLNTLRSSRYDTRNTPYTPVNITDGQALFKFCQEERRRELALEDGHRFIDLKRWGLGVTHTFTSADNSTGTYSLFPNSPLFALPIPLIATVNNPSLVQNPR